jgi:hypothetical protein
MITERVESIHSARTRGCSVMNSLKESFFNSTTSDAATAPAAAKRRANAERIVCGWRYTVVYRCVEEVESEHRYLVS